MDIADNHEYWMAQAISLAHKGYYSTHPNPRVGCVIVADGQMIAEGFHAFPGGPHAEVLALDAINHNARDATVYVTLEPCSHHGKTPPCADALIAAAPDTVVIAMQDPNPLVAGRGIELLRQNGIEVITGVLQHEAEQLNPGFIKRMQQGLPHVRLKMAMTLDGRTALANGQSQWISGEQSRLDVQYLRAGSSAVLSSATTVLEDVASLNVRLHSDQLYQEVPVRQPVRVIIDEQLKLSGSENLFGLAGDIWIFTLRDDADRIARFDAETTRVFVMPATDEGLIDLRAMLEKLAELEINEVHTECGATLAGALVKQQLVDELVIYIAPSLLGNQGKGLFELGEISIMSDKIPLSIDDVRRIGDDLKITATLE